MAQQPQLAPGQSGLPVDNPTKSYWHKEPSEKLLGHRTTEELPRLADVVIVGSGITGAFAAHFLKEKKPGLNVFILEAREACWGATGRNGGHCQPAMYAAAPHIASFELRTYSYLKTLVESFSIPCDWHTTTGVHAFYSPELFAIARDIITKLTDKYPDLAANVAVVTKPGAAGSGSDSSGSPAWLLEEERREYSLEGLRVGGAEGAVVMWHAASLWPYKLVAFVLERLLAANDTSEGSFNLQTNTPVTSLTQASSTSTSSGLGDDDAFRQDTDTGGPWTLHTPRGAITAPRVLLATNGYTSHLLPALADLLIPTKGQVSALLPPSPTPTPTSSSSPSNPPSSTPAPPLDIGHTYYLIGSPSNPWSRDDYLIQRPPPTAELIFGGGREHAPGRGVGVWDDGEGTVDEAVSWYLRGELGKAVDLSPPSTPKKEKETETKTPNQDLQPTHEWTGIMGYTRDGHPLVGPVPTSLGGGGKDGGRDGGLYLCAGYTGHGMPNAALCAKAVVDMMCAGDGDEDPDPKIDLPPEYELTEARVVAARRRPELAVVDAKGSLYSDFGDVEMTGI
ncbi:Uu.00g103050.m01.CDS01 [Anthostomella pinea]|uniref:Uu.00g103050.m01.CDS01 n=1 Tax=Anthostomella pinea TaxID=933095 RepID=A0AAI8VDF8_9PEZI|nr:Uu.00g103050.m01.CDS01 [Anthostomella pinea]